MPGRKPKPTALKALAGNPGKRPLNKSEPHFTGTPSCPSWLNKEAKKEWKRVVAELSALDMLRGVDTAALAAYCQSYARWRSAEQMVEQEGQTVAEPILNKQGELIGHRVKRHPATTIAREAQAAMLKASSLFGFDPSSRSRLFIAPKPQKSELDSILDGDYDNVSVFPA
jgi:P27 family predicted phage terminase small subunit